MSTNKRFGNASNKEIQEMIENIQSKSTQKANLKAARVLRAYLQSRGEPTGFESFDNNTLNLMLSHFYINVRQGNGEKYKTSSLEGIRFLLNRYIQKCRKDSTDLIRDPAFRQSSLSFRAAIQELKKEGKGSTNHYPEICEADLKLIYNSNIFALDTHQFTSRTKFNSTYVSILRVADAKICLMTKETFAINTDQNTGREYVYKKMDELNKNNREDNKNITSGVMPAKPRNVSCPVLSYKLYLSKLSDKSDRLWQRPKNSFVDGEMTWYYAAP